MLQEYENITNYLHYAENPIQFGSVITKKLSVESQKGVIAAQRCSDENQKGAIAVQNQWQ